MKLTKQKIKSFEISRYENIYGLSGLPFGAKQNETYSHSFDIYYSKPKHSTERNSIAWNVWLYKKQIKKGEN